ncbi:MAG: hypothetical protein A2744_00180 [Candidatus Buchananbacteria bacterium RIFCSPHIGHO2_01_FULL_44_11]|uniref:Four helix bundle protein n=1 Tax=Candidatus Buchananbacteria bacterium RIFCSPHIGHO2_01_FULL_44_11 TaxID=1797535 RepID=A0A1G1Y009_9BACT|nr:MAG: hypothetical protein A2744_00180 [Candidatus Buchananbacteria bacterium RIFCSPHIGHO2_01_FULL_44_11]
MNEYQEKLKTKMDQYVHFVYDITERFPKSELYGSTSQWRRATLSIILNYLEGYARQKPLVRLNFLEISFGSLKESKYLLSFAKERRYIDSPVCEKGSELSEEIGAMLWSEIASLRKSVSI